MLHCALEGALVGRLVSRYIGGKAGRQGQVGRAKTNMLLHEAISNVPPSYTVTTDTYTICSGSTDTALVRHS